MEKYCDKLQKILFASGWSQETLAGKLGVSFVTLNSWVNGKSEPRETAREKIDVTFAEILGSEATDLAVLKKKKAEAETKKCSVKKILGNISVLEELTTSLTYHSNGTEGSTMTENDVKAVIYDKQILKNHTSIEQREAINHQAAFYFLLDELREKGADFKIDRELVLATHLRLANGIISDAGCFRNHAVRIRGSSATVANFIKIPELVDRWCAKVNEETTDKIGLLAASHAEFERIHPFSDGNGRTGRLMLSVLALKLGLTPPVLKKERRYAYYKYLELAQTRELTDPLEQYIAESIIDTAEMMESL